MIVRRTTTLPDATPTPAYSPIGGDEPGEDNWVVTGGDFVKNGGVSVDDDEPEDIDRLAVAKEFEEMPAEKPV